MVSNKCPTRDCSLAVRGGRNRCANTGSGLTTNCTYEVLVMAVGNLIRPGVSRASVIHPPLCRSCCLRAGPGRPSPVLAEGDGLLGRHRDPGRRSCMAWRKPPAQLWAYREVRHSGAPCVKIKASLARLGGEGVPACLHPRGRPSMAGKGPGRRHAGPSARGADDCEDVGNRELRLMQIGIAGRIDQVRS
jgi:hypothetical protein